MRGKKIDPETQSAIAESFLDGLSQNKIAQQFQVGTGSVRLYIARRIGRKHMLELIAQRMPDAIHRGADTREVVFKTVPP